MRFVDLDKGNKAIIDENCPSFITDKKWFSVRKHNKWYAARNVFVNGKNVRVYMHRELLGVNTKDHVDHINGNGLDNRFENLRLSTASQNGFNRPKQKNNTSGFKGVHKHKDRWCASIRANKKKHHLGLFDTPELAAAAYDAAALRLHGDFARTNAAAEGAE